MRINCMKGFFTFDEVSSGQVGRFMSLFGQDLVPWRGVFTFPLLASVPEYTIKGAPFLGQTAKATYAGRPEELFEQNGFVYDFAAEKLVLPSTVIRKANLIQSSNVFVSQGLVIPGSLMEDGTRVTDYTAWFSIDTSTFRYSEVTSG